MVPKKAPSRRRAVMKDDGHPSMRDKPREDPPGMAPSMRLGFAGGFVGGAFMAIGWLIHRGPPPDFGAFPLPWGIKLGIVVGTSALIGGAWGGIGGALGAAGSGDRSNALPGGVAAAAAALLLFATVISSLGRIARMSWIGLAVLITLIQLPLLGRQR